MPGYVCPKCGRYGMQWDARAKTLLCYYPSCSCIIKMDERKGIPTSEEIVSTIERWKGEQMSRMMYAIGQEGEVEHSAFWCGPYPSLQKAFAIPGKDCNSVICEVHPDKPPKPIYIWSENGWYPYPLTTRSYRD